MKYDVRVIAYYYDTLKYTKTKTARRVNMKRQNLESYLERHGYFLSQSIVDENGNRVMPKDPENEK